MVLLVFAHAILLDQKPMETNHLSGKKDELTAKGSSARKAGGKGGARAEDDPVE